MADPANSMIIYKNNRIMNEKLVWKSKDIQIWFQDLQNKVLARGDRMGFFKKLFQGQQISEEEQRRRMGGNASLTSIVRIQTF